MLVLSCCGSFSVFETIGLWTFTFKTSNSITLSLLKQIQKYMTYFVLKFIQKRLDINISVKLKGIFYSERKPRIVFSKNVKNGTVSSHPKVCGTNNIDPKVKDIS